jgi:hypothetical protein
MKNPIFYSVITLVAMSIVLLYGFTVGDFASDGGAIIQNPWGIVSLVDLYAGFILFSLWIAYRESSVLLAIIWIILMMTLGFWAGSLYVLINTVSAKGNWKQLLLGKHYKDS